ncbi:MAG TPA: RluA family pseudouridine synthase [Myxococcota bacterium]|nr:RluA family pseudouridine synthase [Myxococcota bacterium]
MKASDEDSGAEREPLAHEFVVGSAHAGERLDRALAALAGVARAQAQRWIEDARVRVNGAPARASQKLAPGDRVLADPPAPAPSELAAEPIALTLLHEDDALAVIDKPAGLVVHPAPGHAGGTLVNALLHHVRDLAGIGGVARPGIVHRLDRGTSGVMVVAKTDAAHQALSKQFHDHTIQRVYVAFARGAPAQDEGRIERAIGRHPTDRKRMSIVTKRGRAAATRWRVLRRFPKSGAVKLEIRPETGRTHQIRVHLAAHGLPLLGDATYGRAAGGAFTSRLARPALHAAVLGFVHPTTGETLRFEAPLPADLAALEATLASAERGA